MDKKSVNVKGPYSHNALTVSNNTELDEDGLRNNGVHMMREIPSEACFAVNGGATGPGGANDTGENAGWESKTQFMLSVVGYSVGLGNIWRFPYLCQKNGGGAFLIPFLIMVLLEGAPLLLIELGIGQKLRQGSLGTWNMIHASIGGIGIASTIVAFLVGLYYNVIITWCFFFLFQSFRSPLPWASCPTVEIGNVTVPVPECVKSSETAYYWYREALDISPSIDETGGIKWWMALCLLLAWVFVYFIIMRGVKSAGWVIYFTACFPYVVLTIFFVRGITLRGAAAGLIHMYKPKMEKLLDLATWMDAATQVFYSFGLAFGSLIAFGSYNKPRNNCVKDVIFITCTNALTAMYASIVIFSILGFKATAIHDRCIDGNKKVLRELLSDKYSDISNITDNIYESYMKEHFPDEKSLNGSAFLDCSLEKELDSAAAGTGLAFVVFTQAIVELPASPFWAIIFFLMLLALGLGSQIGTMEGVVNTVFECSYFKNVRKELLTAIVCFISFVCGLIFVTGAGEYWVSLFDGYASTTGLVIIALLEIVSVMYIYGHERFSADVEYMTGYYPGWYWQITWRIVGPGFLCLLLVGSLIEKVRNSPVYDAWDSEKGETHLLPYPGWCMCIALALIIVGIVPIIAGWLMDRFNILGPSGRPRSASTTMRRIDTAASTRPMMEDYEVTEYRTDILPDDADDMMEGPLRMAPMKSFRMEVIDC
ncbi:sodium- and chloride-dependent transporter XTRP3 isoform X2 [Folsomia candida]|uniref:Transporter n=1 Tax=Folsomia candida TaxID=158441 RepID=A0A226F284_FOLCA|nr:sodium- and chloride-dependent transporter XTRP3 isoform X2 [Folsomia candida]XP_035705199.1 sodium- and chloride-dependent transporter XTRP3 isoform X2 [Folsomia candida]OXA63882.1 Sodium-dependent neutral amino acid transporter B(0)AT2 [Folsomia candida]